MKHTGRSRVRAEDAGVIGDYSLQELKAILPKLNDDAAGVIVDAAVDQKFIDQAFAKGLTYVAANAFEGIVRRPTGLRMIPF